MTTTESNIYADESMAHLDIGAIMRTGHPDIAAGDQRIVEQIVALRGELDRPLRILDVGSGSGDLSARLARRLPDCRVIANEIEQAPLGQAREKLSRYPRAEVFGEAFEKWSEPVDVVVSWGTHHHLAHDYLDHVREILSADGVLIIGDEFCPEYLTATDQARLREADRITVVDGYLFTDDAEIARFRETGVAPDWALAMEDARRRTLWDWYKYVGDFAIAHNCWDVLIAELQIARDDLITSFAGEHKTSPFLLELELSQEGFAVLDKTEIGRRDQPLCSFVLFTARPGLS